MKARQKTDKEMRELDRNYGYNIDKTPSRTRVLVEISIIVVGFTAIISLIRALVSHIH